MSAELIQIATFAGAALFAMMVVGVIFTRMYHRASKETSFVRTGFGGQSVVMNGGALVLPVLHETIPVNMNTLRLEVRRANDQALITQDRMRVDVQAEFYVRVQPSAESIAAAAQTLGRRTMTPGALKELVEGKFVDALRSVASEMSMEDLHERRADFVQKVQAAVSEDLLKNGLELESVSLTGFDQTNREYFNPDNAFDAEGLTRLTEQIETRRKQRNDVEQDTAIEIQKKNLEAERLRLALSRDEEYARLEQAREIEFRRAEQAADIKQQQAEKDQQATQAEISAKQHVDMTRIESDRVLEQERIAKERLVKERDIEKQRAIETAEIERTKAVQLAEQLRAIAIAEKSKDQSEAQASADQARAVAVRAEEEVITVREAEIAERRKRIELIKAAESAEQDAIGKTTAAEAEKQAAQDQAEAVKILATADADRTRIAAEGAAEAEKLRADAKERTYAVEAAGQQALHEAANVLSAEQIAMQVKVELIKALPEIIRQSVKPMEAIDSIKIMQVGGLGAGGDAAGRGAGAGVDGAGVSAGAGGNMAESVVNSALRYRAQAPMVDALLSELGLQAGDLHGLVAPVQPLCAEPETQPKTHPEPIVVKPGPSKKAVEPMLQPQPQQSAQLGNSELR